MISRLKCAIFGHPHWDLVDAYDRVPDGATIHHRDGWKKPIDGCTVEYECVRCGETHEARAPATVPERRGVEIRDT